MAVALAVVLGSPGAYAQSFGWEFTIPVPAGINPDDLTVTFTGTGGTISNESVDPGGATAVVGGNTIDVTWGAPLVPGTVVTLLFSTGFSPIAFDAGDWTVGGASVATIAPGGGENLIAVTHTVWDFIWDQGGGGVPANWTEGIWTVNGTPMPSCTTFPGGVTTTSPPDVHISDHQVCPDWPNDWHWEVTIGGVTCLVWIHWDLGATPEIDVQIPDIPMDITLEVDLAADTYTIREGTVQGTGTILAGPSPWSGYPGNLPPAITVVNGIHRMTNLTIIPTLSPVGVVLLALILLGACGLLIRRRRAASSAEGGMAT